MAKNNNSNEEPNTAPEPDRWYNITLGRSFRDHHHHHHQYNHHSSPKFCTLRYEFKPASIDKSQPGSLHKSKDNRVTVEYHNNQPGKPRFTFEGVSEDYRENDAVLFFDGETFCLERLHRAVKRLRHVRLPGESGAAAAAATATAALVAPAVETYSPPVVKGANQQSLSKGIPYQLPVQIEQIGISNADSLEPKDEMTAESPSSPPSLSATSPDPRNYEPEENIDIVNDDDDGSGTADRGNASKKGSRIGLDIDINLPHQADTDDEIANVDISDDETGKGFSAAEALRSQMNAEGRKEQTSSSSSTSGSESIGSENGSGSGSGSESSSSDSESSDGESVISV